jgi:hypothetical protein
MGFHSTTTLREIRAASPCGIRKGDSGGWANLLRGLDEPHGKPNLDREVTVLEVWEINNFDDALWVLRCPSLERLSRHFGAWCAEHVLHLFEAERPGDLRPMQAIAVARDDSATPEERAAARTAAWAAAGTAARAAAWAAAGTAAGTAARTAAEAAAWAAAGTAAGTAARAAARAAQERHLRKMMGGL